MKKILYTATVLSHLQLFHQPFMQMMKEHGYQVDAASDTKPFANKELACDHSYDVCFPRNPFSFQTFKAYRQIKKIIKDNDYDIIHCNSPTAGILTRLAARHSKAKVIYMAHGFHFFKGAPLLNWLLFYPAEKFASYFTDDLITINNEDYQRAKKHFAAKHLHLIPGVGLDTSKFANPQRLYIDKTEIHLLSVGELNKNKNHEIVIQALAHCPHNIHYHICGQGPLQERLTNLAKELNVNLHLEGFQTNVKPFLDQADIFIFPSLREGLPKSVMEAMANGLPCIVSDIRGNHDLIDQDGGYVVANEITEYIAAIKSLASSAYLRQQQGLHNKEAIKKYDIQNILPLMEDIYLK
ncbi:MAG: glycosyltransferase family 4 protein [Erysipelotrichaceae bacterium]|nr:glycosyltransferase family 4 protein [Erysipelotrichaceae bacterium]MDY5251207.1 glycosyltransferase family 4 protein [Erysipelotrichaceae bacterium]